MLKSKFNTEPIKKTARIAAMVEDLLGAFPEIEADRAVLITESYKQTEGEPIITRRAKAFAHILENIPIVLRDKELIAGSTTKKLRSCQVFPEFSYEWLEAEFDTIATRKADPFYISEETKRALHEAYTYWKGRTTSELAASYMAPETKTAIEHNIFTPGNYFYNGVGHVTVQYEKVLAIGYRGIIDEAKAAKEKLRFGDGDFAKRTHFLDAVILSCEAVINYAHRYAALCRSEAASCTDSTRKSELERMAQNCDRVPEYGARDFYEACQSFWFVQMLLQVESSGHSISPGRFDQYMYPYYKADIESGRITREFAQELIDNIWIKLNDLNKARDAASSEGFAGYGLFQNLIAGGQDAEGNDVTNDLSFMCLEASMHVALPQPSLSVRVWNKSPHEFLLKAAELTRTGIGLPAYYNDEVIIPALMNRGLTLEDARQYNIIGCVEPQKAGKTEGWHDAAFFNMCRVIELVFNRGYDKGVKVGCDTGDVTQFTSYEQFFDAYKKQMEYCIGLLVDADNSIDYAHRERCPLPYESSMVDDCIGRGMSLQEGGAVYNFTGPQGFGIANVADSLYAIKKLVFDDKKVTMAEYKDALEHNFGHENNYGSAAAGTSNEEPRSEEKIEDMVNAVLASCKAAGQEITQELIANVVAECVKAEKNVNASDMITRDKNDKYQELLKMIDELPKYGNDIEEVDEFAREAAYTYSKPLEKYKNPRGGSYQAGLYPVSANVPLGQQTGATPDGRFANTPVADGVGPMSGRDVKGPTATANSVARLDHGICSNGTLFNQKFHPSALAGRQGLENFVALIRGFFDQKGMHVQFNVVSRETLLDAQAHPEKYKTLVVRVAGYSALFTTLSRSLQDDIINRTEQGF